MTVISIHAILTGPAVKTRVTLTVIDDGITRFAWVHRTTQIKMDEVKDDMGETCVEHLSQQAEPRRPFLPALKHTATAKTLLESEFNGLECTEAKRASNFWGNVEANRVFKLGI